MQWCNESFNNDRQSPEESTLKTIDISRIQKKMNR